jgi:uncharacterized protein with HEPN domain
MNGSDKKFLERINKHCEHIAMFIKGVEFDDFLFDIKTYQACILSLEQIGENTRELSKEFKDEHDCIPWKDIYNVRNRIAHDYVGFNMRLLWRIINNNVPELFEFTNKILKSEDIC